MLIDILPESESWFLSERILKSRESSFFSVISLEKFLLLSSSVIKDTSCIYIMQCDKNDLSSLLKRKETTNL